MKKSLLSFALMAAAQVSHAADWHMITSHQTAVWFLDSSSLVNAGSSRTAWAKVVVYRDAVSTGGMRSTMIKYASHCNKRQLQMLTWTQYMMDGLVLGIRTNPEEAREVVPDSVGESVYDAMCGAASKMNSDTKIDDPYGFTDWYFDKDKKKSARP